jgi:hypothetical protein
VAKNQDFNLQRCTRSKPRSDANNCREKRCNHESGRLTRALVKINHFKLNENIGRDSPLLSSLVNAALATAARVNVVLPVRIPLLAQASNLLCS